MKRALPQSLVVAVLVTVLTWMPSGQYAAADPGSAGLSAASADHSHDDTGSVEPTPSAEPTPAVEPTLTPMPMDCPMMDMHSGGGSGMPVHRVGADDRFDRAVELSRSTYTTGTARTAVIVNGFSYYHSVASASLAGAVKGPVLPSESKGLGSAVLSELRRLGVRKVYIVGSTYYVSNRVRDQLTARGYSVVRVAGGDRYATAAAVARKVAAIRRVKSLDTVLVVNAEGPWDALSVSPYAYARKMPVVFISSRSVPASTSQVLSGLRVKKAVVVGSSSAIDSTMYRKVSRLTTSSDARLSASTRFNVNVRVARYALEQGWASAVHPVFASGTELFIDGLTGGTHAGAKGSVLLLTTSQALPFEARRFLAEKRSEVSHVMVGGTVSTVSEAVAKEIGALL